MTLLFPPGHFLNQEETTGGGLLPKGKGCLGTDWVSPGGRLPLSEVCSGLWAGCSQTLRGDPTLPLDPNSEARFISCT